MKKRDRIGSPCALWQIDGLVHRRVHLWLLEPLFDGPDIPAGTRKVEPGESVPGLFFEKNPAFASAGWTQGEISSIGANGKPEQERRPPNKYKDGYDAPDTEGFQDNPPIWVYSQL